MAQRSTYLFGAHHLAAHIFEPSATGQPLSTDFLMLGPGTLKDVTSMQVKVAVLSWAGNEAMADCLGSASLTKGTL